MEKAEENKKLVLQLASKLSGRIKTEAVLREFTDAENYIKGVLLHDKGFPGYYIFIESITAEGEDVIVEGVFRGEHRGEMFGVPPTYKKVEIPMMVRYRVRNNRIVEVFPLSDQMLLFEQLGILRMPS